MAKPFPIDHDLHCHSQLSLCSSDPKMTAAAILDFARAHNYTCQCVTDHFWDAGKPGSSNWYALQDYEHVRASLPLPQDPDGKVRMVFGCETEFCGKNKIGIKQATCDKFDFIVIPPNHFHMLNFVRPDTYNTEQKVADLFVERLEEISQRRLPWRKVGIAHITCGLTFREGDTPLVFRLVDEKRYRAVMRRFARRGTGIEINLGCFAPNWRKREDDILRLYRLALEEGCKFYLASDAHHPDELAVVPERAPEVISLLGLTEDNLYRIP